MSNLISASSWASLNAGLLPKWLLLVRSLHITCRDVEVSCAVTQKEGVLRFYNVKRSAALWSARTRPGDNTFTIETSCVLF